MFHSNIQREVNGRPAEPDSTRDLSGISPGEALHIRLAFESVIREAEAFQVMSDEEVLLCLDNAASVNTQFGLPEIKPEQRPPAKIREGHAQNRLVMLALGEKFAQADQTGSAKGITPGEYSCFIEALQGALREATIYKGLSAEQLADGVKAIKGLYEGWGLDPWTHYDEFLSEGPEFFADRHFTLTNVLFAVNQPYADCHYPDLTPPPGQSK